MYQLNRDWKEFESKLKEELQKLRASEEEIEQIIDGAYQAATEVEDVEEYAKEELNLLREQ